MKYLGILLIKKFKKISNISKILLEIFNDIIFNFDFNI